ncbi:MAG TPA: translation elongation factor Ts [Candidatus Polarisedimenticolaceae bacterium]|nr:translation elongation factor Ts [Candidatus Polarisedimenticolaceae bacterium]
MQVTAAMVKELREKTGVGMMKCKAALSEANGDLSEAEKILRKQGVAAAAKKADRATGEGLVEAYIHTGGKIGVMVEVNCETDFAARSDDFRELVRGIAMHVAAAAPRFARREDVPQDVLETELEIAREQALRSGKPPAVVDKIVEGKIDRFYAENCLIEQPYVRDPDRTVGQLIHDAVSKIGENIQLRRFVRYVLGEAG